MLKTTRLFKELAPRAFKADNNEVVGGGSSKTDETIVDLSKSKNEKSKKLTYMSNIGAIKKLNFLNPNAKKAFNYLQLVFIKAPIFQHFDLKRYIWIEINASSYAKDEVLSQLNLNSNASPNDLNKSDFEQ